MTTPSGSPHALPDTVRRLLDEGVLQVRPVVPAEVSALWQKAVHSAADALRSELNDDTAVQLAYQAQMQAALALLQAHGLRVRSRGGHHANVITALRAFAKQDGVAPLVDALDDLDALRSLRATSVYDADLATAQEAARARSFMQKMLPEAMLALLLIQPALRSELLGLPWLAAPRVGPAQSPPSGPANGSTLPPPPDQSARA